MVEVMHLARRVSIYLPDEIDDKLRIALVELNKGRYRGNSLSEFIRNAIVEKLKRLGYEV